MAQGARNNYIQTANSAIAGQLGNSNLTENLSFKALVHTPIGIIVCINQAGEVFPPSQEAYVGKCVGNTFEDGRAGDYATNQTVDNTGQQIGVNVFGGSWIIAENSIGIGTTPYIRFKPNVNNVQIGAVRNDEDNDSDGNKTAVQNVNFVVRAMSADGKSAYIVQKTMQI